VIAVTGVVASGASALVWRSAAAKQRAQQLAASEADVSFSVSLSLHRDSDLMSSIGALVATDPTLSQAGLRDDVAHLDVGGSYQGNSGIGFVSLNPDINRPAFVHTILVSHPPLPGTPPPPPTGNPLTSHFSCNLRLSVIRPGEVAKMSRSGLASLSSLTSPTTNWCTSAVGRVLLSDVNTGTPTDIPLIQLLRDSRAIGAPTRAALRPWQSLFLVVDPVYPTAAPPTTLQARAKTLIGWTIGLFNAEQILADAAPRSRETSIAIAYAIPKRPAVVVGSTGHAAPVLSPMSVGTVRRPHWVVRVSMSPSGKGDSPTAQGVFLFLIGLVITTLAALIATLLARSRQSALKLVDRKTAELRHQALHDALTGLPNRHLVRDRARELMERARTEDLTAVLLFIDLDDFKEVNDTLGHRAGDELLSQVAERFRSAVSPRDMVGRLGGDEFVVLHEGALGEPVQLVAERVLDAIREPIRLGGGEEVLFTVSASIGIASGHVCDADDLFRDADIALYRAKELGKGCFVTFQPEMADDARRKVALESDLRVAFARNELFVAYQPIVDLLAGEIRCVEALLRWRDPRRGVIPAADFIDALQSTELVVDLGRFVLHEACRQTSAWDLLGHRVDISVNLAARQLRSENLVDDVRSALVESGIEPARLTIEVSEAALLAEPAAGAVTLTILHELGVRIAFDDFGTGSSAISKLLEGVVDVVKIDPSWVHDLSNHTRLDALVQLGRTLNITTIAEGIEQSEQLIHLQEQGCALGQGYLVADPTDADGIEALLLTASAGTRAVICPSAHA